MQNSKKNSSPIRLVSSSTREFIREGRQTPRYSLYDWLHGYIYARYPYLYIGIGTGEHRLVKTLGPVIASVLRWLPHSETRKLPIERLPEHSASTATHTVADGYHGKVVPLAAAEQFVTVSRKLAVNEPISLPNLEHVVPYVRARDIILRNPDHIIALDCPCRSSRENPCLPLDVCLIIGEPFASFVAEHHPHHTRWITPDEAVDILKAEDERGHVHHAFFKDAMLGRFYAICNCCACCCGAMQAQQRGTPMLTSSGYVSQVDEILCIGCGDCVETCQFKALSVVDGHAWVDSNQCMGCGVCQTHCQQGAIRLQRAEYKGEPLELFYLIDALGG